jgi:3-oxoacyl-[acyl-carrier-protein] synthase III
VTPAVTLMVGVGAALPERVVTNAELSETIDTTHEWIVERTGILERRIAAPDETTSMLGARAAQAALENAGLTAADIDLIIVATATPDHTFPATAAKIQAALGVTRGAAFDIAAVCSGFVFALSTADAMLKQGLFGRALVIGAETFSRILDWNDRGTCVLFGDGAGAVVLERADATPANAGWGVLGTHLRTDGRMHDLLYVDGGPSTTGTAGHLRMQGNAIFRQAVEHMSGAMLEACAVSGVALEDVDLLVPHQANQRILDAIARRLNLAPEKVVSTLARHANTSAASIPLALEAAVHDGRARPGMRILFEALGGGLTWGAAMVRYGRP